MSGKNTPISSTPELSKVAADPMHLAALSVTRVVPDFDEYMRAAKYQYVVNEAWASIGRLPDMLFPEHVPTGLWIQMCKPEDENLRKVAALGASLTESTLKVQRESVSSPAVTLSEQAERFQSEIIPLLDAAQTFVRSAGAVLPRVYTRLEEYSHERLSAVSPVQIVNSEDGTRHSMQDSLRSLIAGIAVLAVPEEEPGTTLNLSGILGEYQEIRHIAKGSSEEGEKTIEHWIEAPPLFASGVLMSLFADAEKIGDRIKQTLARELSEFEQGLSVKDGNFRELSDKRAILAESPFVQVELLEPSTIEVALSLPISSPHLISTAVAELQWLKDLYSQRGGQLRANFSTGSNVSAAEEDKAICWLKVSFTESEPTDDDQPIPFAIRRSGTRTDPSDMHCDALTRIPEEGRPYQYVQVGPVSSYQQVLDKDTLRKVDHLLDLDEGLSMVIYSTTQGINNQSEEDDGDEAIEQHTSSPQHPEKAVRLQLFNPERNRTLQTQDISSHLQQIIEKQRLLSSFGLQAAYNPPNLAPLYETPPDLSISIEALRDEQVHQNLHTIFARIGLGRVFLQDALEGERGLHTTLPAVIRVLDRFSEVVGGEQELAKYKLWIIPPQLRIGGHGGLIPQPARVHIEDSRGQVLESIELTGAGVEQTIGRNTVMLPLVQRIAGAFLLACEDSFNQHGYLKPAAMYRSLEAQGVDIGVTPFTVMYQFAKSYELVSLRHLTSEKLEVIMLSAINWEDVYSAEDTGTRVTLLFQSDRSVDERREERHPISEGG